MKLWQSKNCVLKVSIILNILGHMSGVHIVAQSNLEISCFIQKILIFYRLARIKFKFKMWISKYLEIWGRTLQLKSGVGNTIANLNAVSKAAQPIRSAAGWHTSTELRESEKVCQICAYNSVGRVTAF